LYDYSTQILELAPGDEKYLGPELITPVVQFPIIEKRIFNTYEPVSLKASHKQHEANKDPFILNDEDSRDLRRWDKDTIVNGKKLKYYFVTENYTDSMHPLPIKCFKCKYELQDKLRFTMSKQLKERVY